MAALKVQFRVWEGTCFVMLLVNLRHDYNIRTKTLYMCSVYCNNQKHHFNYTQILDYICYLFIHYVFKVAHGVDKLKVTSKHGYSYFIHK